MGGISTRFNPYRYATDRISESYGGIGKYTVGCEVMQCGKECQLRKKGTEHIKRLCGKDKICQFYTSPSTTTKPEPKTPKGSFGLN